MKLLKELRKKPFCNDCHFLLIPLIIIAIGFKHYIFLIFLPLYFLFIIKKTKLIVPITIISLIFFVQLCILPRVTIAEKNSYTCYVYNVEENKNYGFIKGKRILFYDYTNKYKPGDIVELELISQDINKPSYTTDFNYKDYLLSKRVIGVFKASKSIHKAHIFSINSIRVALLDYYEKNLSTDSYNYVKSIVFGSNEFDTEVKEGYSILGISHILAISGMHIIILYKAITLIMKKAFSKFNQVIPLVTIGLYILLIGYPISALRAYLFLLIGVLNEKGSVKYTKLDILSISFIFLCIINPYVIYQTGFKLSFLVSFTLIFAKEIVDVNGLKGKYYMFILIYLVTLPIVSCLSNRISLMSFILSPILSIAVSGVVLPLSYILAFIPPIDTILKYVFFFLNSYIVNIASSSICIPIKSINIYEAIFYYILLSLGLAAVIRKKRKILSFSLFLAYLCLIISVNYINPFSRVTFIDVGQGDSALIEMGNNKANIVIDAYNSFDYLKSTGIKRIDYLILTHSDEDHIKDAQKIIDYFDVKTVLLSYYDKEYNVEGKGIKSGEKYIIEGVVIKVLGPVSKYNDKNSNSIVIQMAIDNITYLFCGDMTVEEENDVIKKYGKSLKSDVLKVGHHGSNTSSSDEFIKLVSPKYSIISVGLNNKYGLPNVEIQNKIENASIVYYTKNNGNITFLSYKSFFHILTYR